MEIYFVKAVPWKLKTYNEVCKAQPMNWPEAVNFESYGV